jgi:hypothetical protein
MISPSNVGFGFPDSTPTSFSSANLFNLDSAYCTAAWNDNLQLEVKGYAGTTLVYDNTYVLSPVTPTLIQFNYFGVNQVDFLPSGGTPVFGTGEQFVIDNMVVAVPEPSFLSLVLLGGLCFTKHIFKPVKKMNGSL